MSTPAAGWPVSPVGLLGYREQTAALLEPLARLGVRTLGELDRVSAAGR